MKNYIVLPINNNAENKDVCITPENGQEYGLSVKLDCKTPLFYIYVDITNLGKIKSVSLNENEYSFSNTLPKSIYKEEVRPKIHYTVKNGWNNDPNGLVFYDGVYHMFYQYNPAGNTWGNMHWGHATSKDLIHFKEEDIALYPDYLGAVYSGSAIVDSQNVSGLKENENDPIILFYTSAGYRFNQCIAYSTDKGKTFKRYKHNPVIPYISRWNRDPKVIKCDELNCYVMALYLDESTYVLFKSKNLIKWEEFQRVNIPGDAECPDLFKIKIENTNDYAYVLEGASGYYLVGVIKDGKFDFNPNPKNCFYGNNISYAGQSYSNIKERVIQVYWQKSIIHQDMPWGSNLSLPQELTLFKNSKSELCLKIYPTTEFDNIKKAQVTKNEISPDFGYDIHAKVTYFSKTALKIFDIPVPVPNEYINKTFDMRIIADTSGLNVYINKGERITTLSSIPNYKSEPIEIKDGNIENLKIFKIDSFLK